MRQRFLWLASVMLLAAGCADDTPSAPETAAPHSAPLYAAQGQPIADEYIVVLQRAANPRAIAASAGATPRFEYSAALNGFAATLNAAQLDALSRNPNVEYIEADQVVTADFTQTMNANGQPWGLDRIDQRTRPLSLTYTYNTAGTGVTVYVIDTGLRYAHTQFGGRASFGFDAFGGSGSDCNGHGTHVGGTIGGSTYGVAKAVGLVAVRVLGCNGSGSISGVIAGVDWVAQHHTSLAVANMSLGGGASTALDQAVSNSINAGVTYAVAAGNSGANACNQSPARAPAALTVAATDNQDRRPSWSNYGTCVDIFAPGVSILSSYNTSNTATATLSGTSMASPHVAGVAALYKQLNPGATPAAVANALISNATSGLVQYPGVGTPNRLLYMGFLGGSPPSTQQIAIASGNNQSGTVGTTLPQALGARVTDGNGNPRSGVVVTFTVTAGGGSVTPTTATTNSQGNASTSLTLGPNAGDNAVSASITGSSVTFHANGTTPSQQTLRIAIVSGNYQSGPAGSLLPSALKVQVKDQNTGLPVAGVTVTFAVQTGGGSVIPLTVITNGEGWASTRLTLGPIPGQNTVKASIPSGAFVTFTANGT